MPRSARNPAEPSATLSLKIGRWFEAHATGWGVVCVPLVVLLVLAAAIASQLGWNFNG